jgi:transcription initiation factor TFIIB
MKNLFVCSTCNTGDKVVTDLESGEVVCTTCGTVIIGQLQDTRRELDQDALSGLGIMSGFGPYSSLATHDMNLSTLIGKSNKDSSGHIINSNTLAKMTKLRAWDTRTQLADSSVRNFRIAFYLLNKLRDKLSVPDSVVESTAYTYRKIEHKGLVRGRTIPSVLAACLYLTCREMGVPRTMSEIQKASNVKKKQIARDYREIVQSLELYVPPVNYFQCLEKISNNLELDGKITRKGMKLMQSIVEVEMSAGKDPMGLAASVLYIASQTEGLTMRQSKIANAAGVSEVTLRARTRDMKNKLALIC